MNAWALLAAAGLAWAAVDAAAQDRRPRPEGWQSEPGRPHDARRPDHSGRRHDHGDRGHEGAGRWRDHHGRHPGHHDHHGHHHSWRRPHAWGHSHAWSHPHYWPGSRSWSPSYAWVDPPHWWHAVPALPLISHDYWEPPVYVERVIEREPVYVERVYQERRPYEERTYAQIIPRAEAKPAPAPAPASRIERLTLSATELFDFDRATLKMPQPKLDEIADVMLRNAQIDRLTITGHTDRIGGDEYNQKLSQRRADAVKAYLVAKGVAPHRLVAVGKGEAEPIVQCAQKDQAALIRCLEPNRRVVVEQITVERRITSR